jgi:hypothetical protein
MVRAGGWAALVESLRGTTTEVLPWTLSMHLATNMSSLV